MSSFSRFLLFLAFLALLVLGVFIYHSTSTPDTATTNSPLLTLDQEFQNLVAKARPSVVSLTARRPDYSSREQLPQLGSGAVVSSDGYIVTNFHVIEGTRQVDVQLSDGRHFNAQFIGADPFVDIAILKIDAPNLLPISFGNSDLVRSGQIVFAIGNPYGLHETVTQGIISGIGRRSSKATLTEFFQTDTAINPGNSGGPLINTRGELIGINNSIQSGRGSWLGIGFAIPADVASRAFEDIKKHGRAIRGWFGVMAVAPSVFPEYSRQPVPLGALVARVYAGSPAQESGIQQGDLIVEFNGKPISDVIDLRNRVAEAEVEKSVNIKLIRNNKEFTIPVTIRTYPG
ncbi:MAG: S1C family serine protease [Chthoniobacterales bacterium]